MRCCSAVSFLTCAQIGQTVSTGRVLVVEMKSPVGAHSDFLCARVTSSGLCFSISAYTVTINTPTHTHSCCCRCAIPNWEEMKLPFFFQHTVFLYKKKAFLYYIYADTVRCVRDALHVICRHYSKYWNKKRSELHSTACRRKRRSIRYEYETKTTEDWEEIFYFICASLSWDEEQNTEEEDEEKGDG